MLGWGVGGNHQRHGARSTTNSMNGRPKGTNRRDQGTAGLPKGWQTNYGNGASVNRYFSFGREAGNRFSQSKWERAGLRRYSTLSKRVSKRGVQSERVDNNLPKKLLKLAKYCKNNPNAAISNSLFRDLIRDPKMYQIAYHKLRSNPVNMTPGINPTTLDGMSLDRVHEIIKKLEDGSFEFSPGRRVQIPKADGKTRPLTIAPPRDKIVQEVIRMVLEAIFEPTFSENSHGFRPSRGCHSALRQLRIQFGGASYYLEGDISKCFDSFDHRILMNIIEKKVKDRRFTNLI